jgi:hypothetical protein
MSTNDIATVDNIVDHTAATYTHVIANASVIPPAAVPAKVDHVPDAVFSQICRCCDRKRIKLIIFTNPFRFLAAYHKEVPVGKPVPSYLFSSVTNFFNDRMPAEQRKVAKDRYTAPDGVPYAKRPRINDVVRRNMSRFNKIWMMINVISNLVFGCNRTHFVGDGWYQHQR